MTWQDEVFVDRLIRLDENKGRRKNLLHTRANGWSRDQVSRWTFDAGRVLSVIGAAVIGFLSVPLLRYAMLHSQGLPSAGTSPELVMVIDALFAFCIAFFLVRLFLSVTCRAHMIAQVAGIWIALTTMHNLVHEYPDIWSQAFSPKWVERTTQMTEPGTIYLMGTSFSL